MDTKWERNVLTVSAPSTPKTKNLLIQKQSPSLMSRLWSTLSPVQEKKEKTGLELMASCETLTDVTEFDPLGKEDWMVQFDSPSCKFKLDLEELNHDSLKENTQKSSVNTPVKSLIDLQLPVTTPNSIVKFTQKDLDNLKRELEIKFNKEFEVAQLEIQEMEAHRKLYMGVNKELEGKLNELMNYESVESERKSAKIQKLLHEIQELQELHESFKKENVDLELKLKKTQVELEEERINLVKIQQDQETSLEKVNILTSKYETLKNHAQEKLDEANVEIAKTRSNYEKEISTLRTKLQRCELQVKNLERCLQLKEEENKELTGICDGLVLQMESMERS